MLHAISHKHASDDEPFGTLILDSADRHLRRKLVTTNQGDEVMIDLPEAVLFADGDRLLLEDGRTIEIIAAKEKLYEVRAGETVPQRHLAWHLGNRHQPAQIDEDRILIRRDHVIRDMLVGLGATVTETIERFQPVHGAYHSHGHDHSHGHEQAHSHAQKDGHGKPDRYGRLPGDPHYGHNHG
jgi:urease accessory protein